jgi:hypothetical protein
MDAIDTDTLCRELEIGWSERDLVALEDELRPFTEAIRRHYAAGFAVASHLPGTSSLCVPVTDITDPEELYRQAEGAVRAEPFAVAEFADYRVATHYSAVPVVLLLLKRVQPARPRLRDLCRRCAEAIGQAVGPNCYFQWNMPGFAWTFHTDHEYEGVSSRVHVPFQTTPDNLFVWADRVDPRPDQWLLARHLERGRVYHARTDIHHTTINNSAYPRLHLILDVGAGDAG